MVFRSLVFVELLSLALGQFGPGYMNYMPVYHKPMVYENGFLGENDGYSGYINDGIGHQVIHDKKHMVNKGEQGIVGNHMAVKNDQGGHGYHQNTAGAKYDQGVGGYSGKLKNHDVYAKDGYGGFGTAGHKKGHKTSGFHKSYHNVESGKDSKFYDEDHDAGEENFGQEYDKNFDDKAWDEYNHGGHGGEYGHHVVNNGGGGEHLKSTGAQGKNWNARDHNGYINNHDLAYKKGHLQSNMRNDLGHGRMGTYYMSPHMG